MTATLAQRAELVDWRALTLAEHHAVLGLEIGAEQLEFAGDVGKSLAACEIAGLAVRIGERHVGRVGVERTTSLRL